MFLIFQILCNNKVTEKIELSKNISLVPLDGSGKYFADDKRSFFCMPSFIFIQKLNGYNDPSSDNLASLKAFLEFYALFFDMSGGWSINSFDLGYTELKFVKTKEEVEKIKKEMQSLMHQRELKFKGTKIGPGLNNIKMDFGFFEDSTKDVLCECSIEETWDEFLLLSEKKRNQISLHLFNPFNSLMFKHNKVYNNEALPIGLQFSVLESLVGRSKSCSNILKRCSSCGRDNLQHDEQSIRSFMEFKLSEYLHFSDNEKYIKLIIDLWDDVRNSLFHNADSFQSLFPINFQKGHRSIEISDIDVKGKTHRKDFLHYQNSLMILKSIIRVMILSKFFSDNKELNKNWPDISLIKTTTV